MASQTGLVDAMQYQSVLSRHPGKVAAPFGSEVTAPHMQHQYPHNFQHYGKAQAMVQQRQVPPTHAMLPHPQTMEHGSSQQQVLERHHREMSSEPAKSGLSITATPFVPTSQQHSNTPPTTRKYGGSNHNVGEGIPPPPSVSGVPVVSHVTPRPLLQHTHVVLPHPIVATPAPGGMLPIPRPHPQQIHVSNPPQFQHGVQRKTSASSVLPPTQSILGGPVTAYQVIDKPPLPTGTIHRQLSGESVGAGKPPPPGLSLPIQPGMVGPGDQGTTPSGPGVVMTNLDLQARNMAINRTGHTLVSAAPNLSMAVGGSYAVRPQPPQPSHELTSLYGAPPKLTANMNASANVLGAKRALLPTPTATGPAHGGLNFLAGAAHHHVAAPTPTIPPGVQGFPGGSMRVPHRVPPPVTNPNGHRQTVMYTQEQRLKYSGGFGRGTV